MQIRIIMNYQDRPDLLTQQTLDRRRLERWQRPSGFNSVIPRHLQITKVTLRHLQTPTDTPIHTHTPPNTHASSIVKVIIIVIMLMIRFKKNHPDHSMCWTRHGEDGFYSVVDAHNHFRWKKQDFPQVNEYNEEKKTIFTLTEPSSGLSEVPLYLGRLTLAG